MHQGTEAGADRKGAAEGRRRPGRRQWPGRQDAIAPAAGEPLPPERRRDRAEAAQARLCQDMAAGEAQRLVPVIPEVAVSEFQERLLLITLAIFAYLVFFGPIILRGSRMFFGWP